MQKILPQLAKPSKLTWIAIYKKQHKKNIVVEAVKKRPRTIYKKSYSCGCYFGSDPKETNKEGRSPRCYSEIKEIIKKTKDEKKAKKVEVMSKGQRIQSKGSMPKGTTSKGTKLGSGGGKR